MPRYGVNYYEVRLTVDSQGNVQRSYFAVYKSRWAYRMGQERQISQQAFSKAKLAGARTRVVLVPQPGVEIREAASHESLEQGG